MVLDCADGKIERTGNLIVSMLKTRTERLTGIKPADLGQSIPIAIPSQWSARMSDVKIRVYRGDERHLATTVTIPGGILRIAANLVPGRALEAMRNEGIDLDELVKLSANPEAQGELIKVEDHDKNEHIVVSLE